MNNWNGTLGRSRRTGLVLPVALLLLVMLTIAAVASMRGTAMQERMAVGQIQMHSSFLDSEQLVWDAAACIRSQYIDANGDFIAPLPDTEDVIAECGADSLNEGALITWDDSVQPWRYNVIAARAFAGTGGVSTGAVSPVVLEVFTPGSLGGNDPPPPLPNISPYACFGSNCALTTAQSAASPTADGTNRLAPDIGERCRIQGRHRPAVDPDGGSVPGAIIPDGEVTYAGSPGAGSSAGFEGEPPLINDPDTWQNDASYIADPKAYIDGIVDPLLEGLGNTGGQDIVLQDGQDGVFVAGPNDVITINEGNATAFGVIILDGGRLEMVGNQCFVGTVIFRNGGEMVALSGTPATVGSVIGYAEDDGDVINPSMGGNPSFYYSNRALEIARDILGPELGPGYIFEIARWRAPIQLDLSAFGLE